MGVLEKLEKYLNEKPICELCGEEKIFFVMNSYLSRKMIICANCSSDGKETKILNQIKIKNDKRKENENR